MTVDGTTYEDFGEGTGYYGTGPYAALGDRLCGVNCRHHWGPWFPGLPRAYHPNPKHPSGKSNAEIYDLTQRQRALERAIRDTKRELRAAEAAYEADPTLKRQAEANRVRESLKRQQERLAKLCDENKDVLERQANREGPIDTRGSAPKGSGKSMEDFMGMESVESARVAAGVSKTALRNAMREEIKADGMPGRHFAHLTASHQQSLLKRALARLKAKPKTTPKHLSPWKKTTETSTKQCVRATHPNYRTRATEWTRNCQRCVGAYELRRRGYDVVAKPRILDGSGRPSNADRLAYMRDSEGWPHMFENPDLIRCASNTGANTGRNVERLMASWGDGARAIVRVQWRRGGGHVFIAEQVAGQTRFIDPQTGSLDCSGYFGRVKRNATYCMRIDDRKYTDLIKKAAEEA